MSNLNGLTLPENIETLFKIEPPLTELTEGFGYMGVVLSDKTTGNLQCHICGEFFYMLSSHIWNTHRFKSKEYKIKFQLPLSFPLCNKLYSQSMRERAQNNRWQHNLPKQIGKKYKGKYSNNASYARNNAAFHNKKGLCELQMEKRYLLIADQLGRDPTQKEIEAHDSKLMWAIKNRYGNINTFKNKYGFKTYSHRHKENGLYLKEASNPYKFFNSLSKKEQEGIIEKYGSINRAVAYLGK